MVSISLSREARKLHKRFKRMLKENDDFKDYEFHPKHSKRIIKGLVKQREKHGEYYCPCRVVKKNDDEWNKSIICPCKYIHDDIRKNIENGKEPCCYCKLFRKKGDHRSK